MWAISDSLVCFKNINSSSKDPSVDGMAITFLWNLRGIGTNLILKSKIHRKLKAHRAILERSESLFPMVMAVAEVDKLYFTRLKQYIYISWSQVVYRCLLIWAWCILKIISDGCIQVLLDKQQVLKSADEFNYMCDFCT